MRASHLFGIITAWLALAAIAFVPITTHIIWCIKAANDTWQPIALLVAGIGVPPIGWFHGVSIIFGFTWI